MLRRKPIVLIHAKELRSKQTEPELLMWRMLRDRRFQNFKFRRQQPMGPYILDFFCAKAKVAVELDGGGHADDQQQSHDTRRTLFLEKSGIKILRFWNNQIFNETDSVQQVIYKTLQDCVANPSPDFGKPKSPSPTRGEGIIP